MSQSAAAIIRQNAELSRGGGGVLRKFEVVESKTVPPLYREKRTSVRYPVEWYPTELYTTHDAERLAAHVEDWLRCLGMMDVPNNPKMFKAIEVGILGGPSRLIIGQSREGAMLVHKFIVAFAMWDDHVEKVEDGEAAIQRVKDLLLGRGAAQRESGLGSDDPYMVMWADFFQTVASFEGEDSEFYGRFVAVCATLLDSLRAELGLLMVDASSVDIDEFIRIKSGSVGLSVVVTLMEAASASAFPTHVYERPDVQRMLHLTDVIVRLVNEIASVPKDRLDGHNTIVDAIVEQHACEPDQAIEVLNRMHDDAVREFDMLEKQLLDTGALDEPSIIYLSAVRQVTAGISSWHTQVARYNKWAIVNHADCTYSAMQVRFGKSFHEGWEETASSGPHHAAAEGA